MTIEEFPRFSESILARVEVLGYGGAFDYQEGHSSWLIQIGNHKPFLVDCGGTVHQKIIDRDTEISSVVVTHTHEDHVGSLSNFIYSRYFNSDGEKRSTQIICHLRVHKLLKKKLFQVNNHAQDQVRFSGGGFFEQHGCGIFLFDTTGQHYSKFPTSYIFITFGEQSILISGDLNTPVFEARFLKEHSRLPNPWARKPENTLIFHEASVHDFESNPHCHYKKLLPYQERFHHFYTYHHSFEQAKILKSGGIKKTCADLPKVFYICK